MVVMPARAATPVDGLAVRRPENVDVPVVRQLLQGAVHGGKAHPVAVRAQPRVQLLGALELAGRLQRGPDGAALPGLDPPAAFGHSRRLLPLPVVSVLVVLGAVRRVTVAVV